MPRRKKNSHADKRESQIRTRLIELSMKVEDFIYYKVPISKTAAESFIHEVNSYKNECCKDERSLQVIDKLTRCMKAIIAEHQEEDSENDYMENVRANSASPVYSLPDEDRTQFSQDLEIPPKSPGNYVIKNKPVYNYSCNRNELNQDIRNKNNGAVEPISLNSNDEDNYSTNVNVDMGMQEALSNLSLNNNNERMYTDIECSQSILNDFEEKSNLKQNAAITNSVSKTIDNTELQNQTPVTKDSTKIVKPIIVSKYAKLTLEESNINNRLVFKVSKAINNTLNGGKQKQSNPTVTGQIVERENNTLCTNHTNNNIRHTCASNTNTAIMNANLSGANVSKQDTKYVVQTKSNPGVVTNVSKDSPNNSNSYVSQDDYDRTQFSQTLQNNIANNKNTVTEIIDLCGTPNDDYNSMTTTTNIDTRSNVGIDVDMHKALSNLSIKDAVNDETMSIDVDSSQSILNNFEENIRPNGPASIVGSGLPNNNNKTCLQIKAPAVINIPNKIIQPNILQQQNLNNHSQLVLKVSKAIIENFNPNTTVNKAIVATNIIKNSIDNQLTHKTENFIRQNNTVKTDTNLKNNTYNNSEVMYYDAAKHSNNIKPIAYTNSNVNEPATVKRKRGPRKNKVNPNEIDKTNSALKQPNIDNNDQVIKRKPRKTYVRKKNDSNKDRVVPIYNKKTENDLSWLEGIRFVREIGEDEYDKKLTELNESFWDNYYLPPNFDDNDFL